MNPAMQLSRRGSKFIQSWEKLRLRAYLDSRGRWTIGWGHTGPEVVQGLTWTQQKADETFLHDTDWAVAAVNELVHVELTQNMFDALVSLVYNIGKTKFFTSTLLKRLNEGDYLSARNQFLVWNKETRDGRLRISDGLNRRRIAETLLWDGP